jgi:exodeoxyribonuclease VII small subunit
MENKENNTNLNDSLKKLQQIVEWFDSQEEVDVEEGLKKVKQGAALLKDSKARLKEIENEFTDIKESMRD